MNKPEELNFEDVSKIAAEYYVAGWLAACDALRENAPTFEELITAAAIEKGKGKGIKF